MKPLLTFCFAALAGCVSVVAQEPSSGAMKAANFPDAVQHAKTVYVAVYHNPMPGVVVTDSPDVDVKKVVEVLNTWPITANDDADVLARIKDALKSWGRFQVATRLSQADLLIVVNEGVDKFIDGICIAGNQKKACSRHIKRHGSLSVYSTKTEPGLIWRKPLPAEIQEFRRDVEDSAQ